jgi:hypothetical protein
MGPLFSLILIAIVSATIFMVVFFAFRMFMPSTDAFRRACGFVVGIGAGAGLSVGLLALVIGGGASLATKVEVFAYLATVATAAIAGGAFLSYLVARKFR